MASPTSRMRLPDFIGLGGMRCGSTWLHQLLALHPEVFVPPRKELHFWSRGILEHDLDWYAGHFAGANGRRVCGEISPSYSMLKPAVIDCLRKALPEARLVLLIRNPIERAWSHFLLELQLRSRHRSARRASLPAALRHFEHPRSRRRSDYETTIRRWRGAYGKAALLVSLYDRLGADPEGLAASVLDHIGADPNWRAPAEALERRVWATQPIEMPPIVGWYLARQWLEPVRRLNDYLDGAVTAWVSRLSDLSVAAPPTWLLVRAANRVLLSLPERVAYHGYDTVRDRRLARRCATIPASPRAEQLDPPAAL